MDHGRLRWAKTNKNATKQKEHKNNQTLNKNKHKNNQTLKQEQIQLDIKQAEQKYN